MKDKHWMPSKLLKLNSRNIFSPDPSIAKTFLREISKNTPENEISTDFRHRIYIFESCPNYVWNAKGRQRKKWRLAWYTRNYYHCVKSVQIQSFFWSIFSRVCTEYVEISRTRKIRTRKTRYLYTFQAVYLMY